MVRKHLDTVEEPDYTRTRIVAPKLGLFQAKLISALLPAMRALIKGLNNHSEPIIPPAPQ